MNTLWQDLRYAMRLSLKNYSFTMVAVLTLALGIGANTAIFSVVNAVLLRKLPYPEPEDLTMVWETNPEKNIDKFTASPLNYLDWVSQNRVFESMSAFDPTTFSLTGKGEPEQIGGALVSERFFSLLGVRVASGRDFQRADWQAGAEPVAIVSHSLWQRRFGANPGLIGESLTLDGKKFTVIGIMPPRFGFPYQSSEIWVPLMLGIKEGELRNNHYLLVIARLNTGVKLEQAQAEMNAIASRLEQQYGNTNAGWRIKLVSLREQTVGDIQPAILILFVAVGFVLLIACANVANLLLARNTSREKEFTIRAALGADRIRLIRQLLTESLMLSCLGGALGLLLAIWGVQVLLAISPADISRTWEINLDPAVLGFTMAISVGTGLIFGLFPALQSSKINLNESLKEGSRSISKGGQRLRGSMVITEIALSLVLLIGAGLLIKSFISLQRVDPGFEPDRVLAMQLVLPESKYSEPRQRSSFYAELLQRIAVLPAVESAAAVNYLPLADSDSTRLFMIEGSSIRSLADLPAASYRVVTPEYFRTMGIPLRKGRLFTERDGPESMKVVIINDSMARRFWPNEDPIGKRINMGGIQADGSADNNYWRLIVGVVGNVRHYGLDAEARDEFYFPYFQSPSLSTTLVVRTASDPTGIAAAIRAQIRGVDPDQPIGAVRAMKEIVAESLAAARFCMLLLSAFAVIAVVLATVGIYGLVSYSVVQRTHEIGIRIAMGAQNGDVLKLVVGQGMIMALIGVTIGLATAFVLTRLMASLLYGVSATDPMIFVGVSLLLTVVALLACYIPGYQATKVDPIEVLRCD